VRPIRERKMVNIKDPVFKDVFEEVIQRHVFDYMGRKISALTLAERIIGTYFYFDMDKEKGNEVDVKPNPAPPIVCRCERCQHISQAD
jgi:hypothetical protein